MYFEYFNSITDNTEMSKFFYCLVLFLQKYLKYRQACDTMNSNNKNKR